MTGATAGLVISVKGDNNMDSVDKLMPEEEENLHVVSFYADGYGIYVSFTNSKKHGQVRGLSLIWYISQ